VTLPRSTLVSLQTKPHYHCNGRFVRRAFLCGVDRYSGQSFKHRRGWIVDKLAELSNLFAIDVASYAVMSNHYHLVLKINADTAAEWSDREVVERWCSLFAGHTLVQRYRARESMSQAELEPARRHSCWIGSPGRNERTWALDCRRQGGNGRNSVCPGL